MIEFIYHESLMKDIAALERRYRNLRHGLEIFERLCAVQFEPVNPQQVIAPAKLHRISQNELWTVWKIELMIPGSGLRPNQMPRMWFAVRGAIIAFLCLGAHADNYQDNEMERLARKRAEDIF